MNKAMTTLKDEQDNKRNKIQSQIDEYKKQTSDKEVEIAAKRAEIEKTENENEKILERMRDELTETNRYKR